MKISTRQKSIIVNVFRVIRENTVSMKQERDFLKKKHSENKKDFLEIKNMITEKNSVKVSEVFESE